MCHLFCLAVLYLYKNTAYVRDMKAMRVLSREMSKPTDNKYTNQCNLKDTYDFFIRGIKYCVE